MPHLCYFLSSLKANYHNIEYHNYNHALSHAQSMYWILRRNPGIFTELEVRINVLFLIHKWDFKKLDGDVFTT